MLKCATGLHWRGRQWSLRLFSPLSGAVSITRPSRTDVQGAGPEGHSGKVDDRKGMLHKGLGKQESCFSCTFAQQLYCSPIRCEDRYSHCPPRFCSRLFYSEPVWSESFHSGLGNGEGKPFLPLNPSAGWKVVMSSGATAAILRHEAILEMEATHS